MAKFTTFSHFLWLHLIYITMVIDQNSLLVHSKTLQSDINALTSILNAVDPFTIPPSSFLRTWDFKFDPCESDGGQFLGIVCTFPSQGLVSRVSVIKLDEQGYDGLLSPAIGNLSELISLDLSNNKLRGQIPKTIYNLNKLTTLTLSGNFFTGNFPTTIDNFKILENLDLSRNRISGQIPKTISSIRTIKVLKLSNNSFSGRIPSFIGLWQLNTLELGNNQLSGNLPQFPVNLRTLSLGGNRLTGHLSPIVGLQNLKTVDLSDNRFTGIINLEIFTLPNVNSLNLSLNSLTRIEIKDYSGKSSQLREVDLHGNHLRGSLPVNLATYENLVDIDLGNNEFRGQIPAEYGRKLSGKWRSLFLDHNFLSGNLPTEFRGNLARTKASLAQNCLACPKGLKLCDGGQRPASDC